MKTKPVKEVKKVWGREIWICNNKKYCGKLLIVDKGSFSSWHYHRKKDETWFISEGRIRIEYDYQCPKQEILNPGDVFRILPEVVHRFTGLDNTNIIIEFSTHHQDADSYRIEVSGKATTS